MTVVGTCRNLRKHYSNYQDWHVVILASRCNLCKQQVIRFQSDAKLLPDSRIYASAFVCYAHFDSAVSTDVIPCPFGNDRTNATIMRLEWFKSSARCRTAQQEIMPTSQHTAVAESPVCRHYLWLSAHPTSQGDVGRQQESQDQVRSRRQVQRDLVGAELFRTVGIGDNGVERVGHLTDATIRILGG